MPNEQAVGSLLLPDIPLAFQIPHWVSIPLQQHLLSGPGLSPTGWVLGSKNRRLHTWAGTVRGPAEGCAGRQWQAAAHLGSSLELSVLDPAPLLLFVGCGAGY